MRHALPVILVLSANVGILAWFIADVRQYFRARLAAKIVQRVMEAS
jgi:hypothetical protein